MKLGSGKGTGTVFQSGGRRFVYFKGKRHPYSNMLWNFTYPDNQVVEGEVVHHRDFNPLNDSICNYEKLSRAEHTRIHSTGKNNPFYGKTHTAASRKKMSAIARRQKRVPPIRHRKDKQSEDESKGG